ncbi:MAG: CBS domain-containing protein [Patescibacteria group bacterium]|nr:CBS domain-containing protein [Patescibacteria group bacterium]
MELIQIILLIVLIAVTVYGILLIRSFEFMSVRELKRQARMGNPDAIKVYPVRAYGMQLWIFMWAILGFLTTSIILMLKGLAGNWVALLINVPLIVILHAVLPWSKRPKPSLHMAAIASPVVEFILRKTYPIMRRLEKWVGRWIQPEPFMLIQSKEELLEILRHNADEFDKISKHELTIAENALLFGEKLVSDHMIPLNTIHFVNAEEELTPVVIDELHKSGHSRFPVYKESEQNIVGTLYIRDAVRIKKQKPVHKVMKDEVYYINEKQPLDTALNAFLKTRHHLFVVVNEFEDVVGVITIEDVLEQIVGQPITDENDAFEDLRAVAKAKAIQKHIAREPKNI